MFVETPRIRNSATARRARATAMSKVRPRQVSLASIESKCAETSAPVYVVPPSSRTPAPPGERYVVIRPVSGRKLLAGSSVVIRHWSAAPRSTMSSWRQPEVGERLAGRDPQLALHQVDVGDLLGHGVLDLDPRVHLDEDVVAVGVEQELDGAGVAVADLGREPHGVGAHPVAQLRVEVGGGRDLDDLLVAALHRAVALEEVDHVALGVGEDLHLDVARVDHGLLDEDGRVAERALAPRACRSRPPRAARRGRRPGACRGRRRRRRP